MCIEPHHFSVGREEFRQETTCVKEFTYSFHYAFCQQMVMSLTLFQALVRLGWLILLKRVTMRFGIG